MCPDGLILGCGGGGTWDVAFAGLYDLPGLLRVGLLVDARDGLDDRETSRHAGRCGSRYDEAFLYLTTVLCGGGCSGIGGCVCRRASVALPQSEKQGTGLQRQSPSCRLVGRRPWLARGRAAALPLDAAVRCRFMLLRRL